MSVLPYQEIKTLCQQGMIAPWVDRTVVFGMSYGLGPCSYDVRISQDILMWPGRFSLASTIEWFDIPDDVCGRVADKSTWARRGLAAQTTLIDPGFCGGLTLELNNHSWLPIRLKKGMPIVQIVFDRLSSPTEKPYKGKYSFQAMYPQGARYDTETQPTERTGLACEN